MRTLSWLMLGIVASMGQLACGGLPESGDAAEAAASSEVRGRTPQLDPLFDQAAREFRVPVELLKAIGLVQTRWQMVRGEEEFEGVPAAYGIMALRGEQMAAGAALAGVPEGAVRAEPLANIRAAAALLSKLADELRIDRTDLAAWAPVAARLSGIQDPGLQALYIRAELYKAINEGASVETSGGGLLGTLSPVRVEPLFSQSLTTLTTAPDYLNAVWRPSPNFDDRPTDINGDPAMLIIHTCEGSYSSCLSTLTDPANAKSAHYVVREDGGEISQLVQEAKRAWHIAATYDCSLNSSVECWRNNVKCNDFTIGIEHAGFASQTTFPTSQIDASARLACDITRDQAITRDRFHIIGHGQLQPWNRVDPGPNWPWTDYMNRISRYCSPLVVDSNNSNNDRTLGYIEVSANWISSSNIPGYYGTGYFYAPAAAVSDGATFWFYMTSPGTRTVDAWWTAASDRTTSAPYRAFDASGAQVGAANVNQQLNGGRWNTLGTWNFTAGWNRIVLSRWTSGSVVIADAVRIR